jgi:aryl-alcohol dehydrogenase-like predicted oxidoreductase
MKYYTIGDLKVSAIGMGSWQIAGDEWGWGSAYTETQTAATLDRAVERGITFLDTAEGYGGGETERVLGRVLRGIREKFVVATKIKPTPGGLDAKAISRAAENSMRRLQTDYLDLLQIHWEDPEASEEEIRAGVDALCASGKVRVAGVCNYTLDRWKQADQESLHGVLTNQVRYNLLTRDPEIELLPWAQSAGRFVVAWGPLEQGVLAGRYSAEDPPAVARDHAQFLSAEGLRIATPVIQAVSRIADERGVSCAQVSLAWLLSHPHVLATPGMMTPDECDQNADAADIELKPEELALLEKTSASVADSSRRLRAA